MKYIWCAMIVLSVAAGLATGRGAELQGAILDGASDGATLIIGMVGAYCRWLGLLGIARDSGMTEKLARLMKKPLSLLFRGIRDNEEAMSMVTMNIVANMLGMGNAATPFGIKAIAAMNREKVKTPTDDMCLFLILNTASVQLLPTSIIAVRRAAGSAAPGSIVVPSLAATFLTAVIALILGKACAAVRRRVKRK